MQDMLKKENIQILPEVESWQEAVRVSIEPLIKGGYVEARYVDGVLDNTQLYGPYYVLAPDLALIHARAEQGVLHRQLAVTLLRKPVRFSPEGYDVRLLVVLAAENPQSHTQCLKRLAGIFGDDEAMAAIVEAQSCDELYGYFTGGADSGLK